MSRKDFKDDKIVTHFLIFIGNEAYSLITTLAFTDKPISLTYVTLKQPLWNHEECTCFECRER